MALIELATNHDINAIVEAIRSLKSETNHTAEIAKSFIIPFLSAFGGVALAYKFHNRSSRRQLCVQKIIEMNALAQEIDRLANQLLRRKNRYYKEITDEPHQRLSATRTLFRAFRPPRFHTDGRLTLDEELSPCNFLTILDIDDLFADFELCFERWTSIENWHIEFTDDKPTSVLDDTDSYTKSLKFYKPELPSSATFTTDYAVALTDHVLLTSYHYIVGIRKSCIRQFGSSAIEAAGGLYFSRITSPTKRAELLKPLPQSSINLYPEYARRLIEYTLESGLEPPTAEQIEIDQKIGAST